MTSITSPIEAATNSTTTATTSTTAATTSTTTATTSTTAATTSKTAVTTSKTAIKHISLVEIFYNKCLRGHVFKFLNEQELINVKKALITDNFNPWFFLRSLRYSKTPEQKAKERSKKEADLSLSQTLSQAVEYKILSSGNPLVRELMKLGSYASLRSNVSIDFKNIKQFLLKLKEAMKNPKHEPVVDECLKKVVTSRNDKRQTALHIAVLHQCTPSKAGQYYPKNESANFISFEYDINLESCLEATKLLLESELLDVNAIDIDGNTPLSLAILHYEELLKEKGIFSHNHDTSSECLSFAKRICLQIIKLLLNNGAKLRDLDLNYLIQKVNENGDTLLHTGKDEDINLFQLLLPYLKEKDKNIIVNITNNNGHTPLHIAVDSANHNFIKLLIDNGADVNAADKKENTPLYFAIKNLDKKCIELLLSKGANLRCKNIHGRTPLHFAVRFANPELIKLLIVRGAEVNELDKHGKTPLHYAIKKGDQSRIKLLIDNGANVNAADEHGKTPLHYAINKGDQSLIKLLIDNGANVNAADESGKTPLDYAINKGKGDQSLIKLLKASRANVNAADKNGNNSLHYAIN